MCIIVSWIFASQFLGASTIGSLMKSSKLSTLVQSNFFKSCVTVKKCQKDCTQMGMGQTLRPNLQILFIVSINQYEFLIFRSIYFWSKKKTHDILRDDPPGHPSSIQHQNLGTVVGTHLLSSFSTPCCVQPLSQSSLENPTYKWMIRGYHHFRKPPYILYYIPVVPHKAVAEVSKIGNL